MTVTDKDREALRMNAYYYGFTPTGEYAVDKILSAVAHAGKAFHSTEEWNDTDCYKLPDFGGSGCPQEWIQFAAQECAQAIAAARAEEREANIAAIRKACPRAHTYASENADLYRAHDDATKRAIAAIRARGED